MKMLSVAVDERFVRQIDSFIRKSGAYASRSEFLKEAIRKNFVELMRADKTLWEMHEAAEQVRELARKRGGLNRKWTKADRDKLAEGYAKEHGLT